jgi:16S rRNA (uracil1498-N3)-methyltransferase
MHIFYTPDILADHYTLNEEESRHCIRVLRLQKGDLILLVDGRGGLYNAVIEDAHPTKTQLRITSVQRDYGKRNHHLHIAIAPTKNIDRIEWFAEKATEIGIDEITPVICERSERKSLKTSRLNKVITSAVKQSARAYHPQLNEPRHFKDFISSAGNTHKYIAHCMESEKTALQNDIVLNSDYLVVIGPEGDFTPAEVEYAINAGFKSLSLGNSRLRTETAALEACFEVNFLNR